MADRRPNIILTYIDNLGYGDLGCYGSTVHRTPHLDRMAAEGMRFTSFYSTSGVCTPSRTSIMTGCYPRRVGMHISDRGGAVLQPVAKKGLNPREITIATLLKSQGYSTACIGKWHLGDQLPFLPTRHGFDHYFGIPYSDDMDQSERHPQFPPIPLMRQEEVIEAPVDRDYLTKRYTEEAISYIAAHRDEPFFIYLPHAMPGSTAHPFASPDFQGKSANGAYGDSIEELDWSHGQIARALVDLGLDENTLVLWTSDNGAVGRDPQQGSNAPLKGWGYDTSEGAMRMPCIARWPGHIEPGTVCDELTSTMDMLPTCAGVSGTTAPQDRIIDGQDIRPMLLGNADAHSAYDDKGFFYYFMGQLQAVRAGDWKLYLPLADKQLNLRGDKAITEPMLYDVRRDLGEENEVSSQHPDVVSRLLAMAEAARADIGDMDRQGSGQRPAGWIEEPEPRLLPKGTPA